MLEGWCTCAYRKVDLQRQSHTDASGEYVMGDQGSLLYKWILCRWRKIQIQAAKLQLILLSLHFSKLGQKCMKRKEKNGFVRGEKLSCWLLLHPVPNAALFYFRHLTHGGPTINASLPWPLLGRASGFHYGIILAWFKKPLLWGNSFSAVLLNPRKATGSRDHFS